LDRLLQREVIVYAVTIGDADKGHAVPSDPGDGQPMVYRGKPVESRRFDATLREIAEQTKGLVIPLGLATGDPSLLYRKQIEPSARRRGQVPRVADMAERFPLFLVAALSCLFAACWPRAAAGRGGWAGEGAGHGPGPGRGARAAGGGSRP
jgi:Ca-activated chloride channel family protein